MQTLHVELAERRYPIHVGPGLLNQPEQLSRWIDAPALLLVTDSHVAEHYLAPVESALGPRLQGIRVLPPGEAQKSMKTLDSLFDSLAEAGIGRDGAIVALGGGVIGDLSGFAAACWQRGIAFYQLPTTLLAQVDSSVGGKTAINHTSGKNLIGAFHQPRAVIADSTVLSTLPEREYRAGLAEVVKYGFIADVDFLAWLEGRIPALNARDADTIAETVTRCCAIKARVVAEDETEQGRRAILNFGHTFGHAIEGACGYGEWLHGEAVAAGMAQALALSCRLERISQGDHERGLALLRQLHLPVTPPALDTRTWLEWMARDKKATREGLRLVLLRGLGRAELVTDVPTESLEAVLQASSP
ncbi:3-dehydroquinate synthase [Natronospira proteinivora]|uniref:3-dehydroquinate synthase n=1 Tax=Natronospira proteinivora TaxID=1807133 RepID=A0ABT1G9J8_9GAMM|nr:3-dehydroquinate synthase [Natronospira proteinivora]MCP1727999.1 3-dehydroquinate synthase [Natronospira proteinivora]